MAAKPVKLTKTAVEGVPLPSTGQRSVVWDLEVKGFGVRVTSAGVRTYVLRYRMGGRASQLRTFTIGQHGSPWTADQARRRALELLAQVRTGTDPAEQRTAARRDVAADAEARADRMFAVVADRWYKQHVIGTALRSAKDIKGVLERDLKPAFATSTIEEITRKTVSQMVEEVGERSHDAANKAFKWLRQLLNWCVEKGVIGQSPLGAGLPFREGKRTRKLSLLEVVIVWTAVERLAEPFRSYYRFLILTGQRLREVSNLSWSELDVEEGDWLIPAARTKNKNEHLVPLSDQALDVLERLQPDVGRRFGPVFTTDGKVGISGFSKLKDRIDELTAELTGESEEVSILLPQGLPEWVVHDFRRTITTACQGMAVPLEVTEAVLNHVSGSRSGVAGVYHLYDYYDEKAEALQKWADLLTAGLACWRSGDFPGVLALDPSRRTRRRQRRGRGESIL